jgi:hypothetical protein
MPHVDEIEVAKFPEFKKAQQLSIAYTHLHETSQLKIRHFFGMPETDLGAGGRAFKSPRPDQTVADSKRVICSFSAVFVS